MIFKLKGLLHAPEDPYHTARVAKVSSHAIVDLEGGDDEVLCLFAFGKDLGIEIRIDDNQAGVVITTLNGMWRQTISKGGGQDG